MSEGIPPVGIYLAGPMDGIDPAVARGWREEVALQFQTILFFMPTNAYRNAGKENASLVEHFNRSAILNSHALFANLSGEGRGFGTIREIEFARTHGRPVAVLVNKEDPSIGEHTLYAYDVEIVYDMESGILHLLELVAKAMNQPPTIFGLPIMQIRPEEPEED